MTNSERAIEILKKTNDGKTLFQTAEQIERYGRNGDGWQLVLVQGAINNHLTGPGQELFETLHRQVLADDYSYPLPVFREKFCS